MSCLLCGTGTATTVCSPCAAERRKRMADLTEKQVALIGELRYNVSELTDSSDKLKREFPVAGDPLVAMIGILSERLEAFLQEVASV